MLRLAACVLSTTLTNRDEQHALFAPVGTDAYSDSAYCRAVTMGGRRGYDRPHHCRPRYNIPAAQTVSKFNAVSMFRNRQLDRFEIGAGGTSR